MKSNIVYPIITTAILAVIGIVLDFFGFNFKGFICSLGSYAFLKEFIFVLISFLIISCVIVYDIIDSSFKKKSANLEKICEENKTLKDTVSKLENSLNQAKMELNTTKTNLNKTKHELINLLEIQSELKRERALKNFKNDNN